MPNHSIAGEWRGHYTYRDRPDQGSSFSAFLKENLGAISGAVVDDEYPGTATVEGRFSFPEVRFTKTYTNPTDHKEIVQEGSRKMLFISNTRSPIDYLGTMTDDGKTMNGTWTINSKYGFSLGNWVAHRLQEEETDVMEEVGESLFLEE